MFDLLHKTVRLDCSLWCGAWQTVSLRLLESVAGIPLQLPVREEMANLSAAS